MAELTGVTGTCGAVCLTDRCTTRLMTGATHRRGPHATSRPAASRHAGAIVTAAPRVGWTLLLKRRHSGCHRGEHTWPRGHRQPYDACADARPPARPGTCSADPSQPTAGLTGLLHSNTPPTPAAVHTESRRVGASWVTCPAPATVPGRARLVAGLPHLSWRWPVDTSGHVENNSF